MPVVSREGTAFWWTRDAKRFPWLVSCNREHCFYKIATASEEQGQVKLALHDCPYPGGTSKITGVLVERTLVERTWDMLDVLVDKIMDPDTPIDEKRDLQNQAKGIAKVLAIFMVPAFEFPHQISAEAKARWQARVEGREYETIGLGSRRYEFVTDSNKMKMLNPGKLEQPTVPPSSSPKRTRAKPEKQLSPADIEGIRNAAAAGFSHEQLAGIYGVSSEQISKVVT